MTSTDSQLSSLERAIQHLYDFRDSYFVTVSEDLFANKNAEVQDKLQVVEFELWNCLNQVGICLTQDILKQLDEYGDLAQDKATFFFLRGWLLNIKNDFNKEVFDLLTKSIKLRPNYHQAWIELGECYFKKGDLKLALNCFETVLKQSPVDKKALRNASIILRSLSSNEEEKRTNVAKSIEYAKKAVECDLNDGNSWAVLANAHLTLLFMSGRTEHQSLIKNCKSAYQKALADAQVATKADVLFNYGSILQYEEEFQEALNCLAKAFKYDPEWRELEQRKSHLEAFFGDIVKIADISACLKAKRLNSMMEKLKCEEDQARSRYADKDEMCNGNLKQLRQLSQGPNDCLVLCKVISYISDPHNVFLCSVLNVVDSLGHSIALFIYDIIHNKGPRSGDSILIIRPLLKSHRIQFDNKEYAFDAIKIVKPLHDMLVNNKQISLASLSVPVVNVTLKGD